MVLHSNPPHLKRIQYMQTQIAREGERNDRILVNTDHSGERHRTVGSVTAGNCSWLKAVLSKAEKILL